MNIHEIIACLLYISKRMTKIMEKKMLRNKNTAICLLEVFWCLGSGTCFGGRNCVQMKYSSSLSSCQDHGRIPRTVSYTKKCNNLSQADPKVTPNPSPTDGLQKTFSFGKGTLQKTHKENLSQSAKKYQN